MAAPQATPENMFVQTIGFNSVRDFNSLIQLNQANFNPSEFVDNIRYQGFERDSFILAATRYLSASQMIRLALIGAIRGANFEKIISSSSRIDDDLKGLSTRGVIKRRATGANDITILRCTAAIPQWCSHFLGTAGVSKKIASLECPAAFQFPAAAALPMSRELRLQHIRFSIHFSRLIKGIFNENIYATMMANTIPLDQIPDTVKLQLGTADYNVDIGPMIADVQRELGVTTTPRQVTM